MKKINFVKRPTKITILKKNQIILATISLMLITAGYLNYSTNQNDLMQTVALTDSEEIAGIGDARLVSSSSIVDNENSSEVSTEGKLVDNNNIIEDKDDIEETVSKTVSTNEENYYIKSRLERQTMYSQMLESYQKVLDNQNISSEQKNISQNEIIKINNTQNGIMISENLIKSKGFEDIVIFVNNDSVNIVVKKDKLSVEEIAQIQNIICRELNFQIENIHISAKNN